MLVIHKKHVQFHILYNIVSKDTFLAITGKGGYWTCTCSEPHTTFEIEIRGTGCVSASTSVAEGISSIQFQSLSPPSSSAPISASLALRKSHHCFCQNVTANLSAELWKHSSVLWAHRSNDGKVRMETQMPYSVPSEQGVNHPETNSHITYGLYTQLDCLFRSTPALDSVGSEHGGRKHREKGRNRSNNQAMPRLMMQRRFIPGIKQVMLWHMVLCIKPQFTFSPFNDFPPSQSSQS